LNVALFILAKCTSCNNTSCKQCNYSFITINLKDKGEVHAIYTGKITFKNYSPHPSIAGTPPKVAKIPTNRENKLPIIPHACVFKIHGIYIQGRAISY